MIAPRLLRRGVVVFVATTLGLTLLAWVSALPLAFHPPAMARLRLSWSAQPERIETCRTLSAEELAERLEHMRQRVECEGRFATYSLRVELDRRMAGEVVVKGGGLRQDRLLHLLREFAVPPGPHRLRVTFTRREQPADDSTAVVGAAPVPGSEADTGLYAGRAQREVAERARRGQAAIPGQLALDTSLVFAPGRVVLVTLGAGHRMLELRTEATPPR